MLEKGKFTIKNEEVEYCYEWLDNVTFLFYFGNYIDKDEDEYYISCEYWKDEDSWHFNVVFDDDLFSATEEYLSKDEINHIKNTMKLVM